MSAARRAPAAFVHSPRYEVDIGPHVFPTVKYRLVRESLVGAGLATDADFAEPAMPSREELLQAHLPEYLDDLAHLRPTRRTMASELPLTREIVEGFTLAAGGSILGAATPSRRARASTSGAASTTPSPGTRRASAT
jgi:acetoin utilization deacetylase AcuC-like enzyme